MFYQCLVTVFINFTSLLYSNIEDILQNGSRKKRGESSQINEEIATSYMKNQPKFLSDTSSSLCGHETTLKLTAAEMMSAFQKFDDGWKEHLANFNAQADKLIESIGRIRILMDDSSRNI